jgi:hypothetical protein
MATLERSATEITTVKRTLRMKFGTNEGKATRVSLSGCKEGITAQEAESAMDTMIASQIFMAGLGDKRGASVTKLTETVLF